MSKEINALELRKRFGEIMEEVRYRREPYIVKRNGRPIIVLLDIEAYEAVKTRLDEEAFVEEYTKDRIQEFLKENELDKATAQRARKLLRE